MGQTENGSGSVPCISIPGSSGNAAGSTFGPGYIITSGQIGVGFSYGTYQVDLPITVSDRALSDSTGKIQIFPTNTEINYISSISGNFGVSGSASNYTVSFRGYKSGLVDAIQVNDYMVIDNTCSSTFLTGVHRVLSVTSAGTPNWYDISMLNRFSGPTGPTSISGSVVNLSGGIKIADLVFSLTHGNDTLFYLDNPNKCLAFGQTGGTGGQDIVLSGWAGGNTGTGIVLKNGAAVSVGNRVHFVDLNNGVVMDRGYFSTTSIQ